MPRGYKNGTPAVPKCDWSDPDAVRAYNAEQARIKRSTPEGRAAHNDYMRGWLQLDRATEPSEKRDTRNARRNRRHAERSATEPEYVENRNADARARYVPAAELTPEQLEAQLEQRSTWNVTPRRIAAECVECGEPREHPGRQHGRCNMCRFAALTAPQNELGCSVWQGSSNFYFVPIDGPSVGMAPNRWIYSQLVGEIPYGWKVRRTCRTRGCVTIGHLEAVAPDGWGEQRQPAASWGDMTADDHWLWVKHRRAMLPALIARCGGACEFCGEQLDLSDSFNLTVDHNPPIGAGGILLAELADLRLVHRRCNSLAYWTEQRALYGGAGGEA